MYVLHCQIARHALRGAGPMLLMFVKLWGVLVQPLALLADATVDSQACVALTCLCVCPSVGLVDRGGLPALQLHYKLQCMLPFALLSQLDVLYVCPTLCSKRHGCPQDVVDISSHAVSLLLTGVMLTLFDLAHTSNACGFTWRATAVANC